MADGRTLIFSSDRPGGFGGFDLYRSHLQEGGKWCEPVNLGSRINTEAHETLASMPASEETIYFSRRSNQYAGLIFSAPIEPPGVEAGVVAISGTVRNARKPEQTLTAEFRITDLNNDDKTSILRNNEDDGTYMLILDHGKNYDLSVWSSGFTFYSTRFYLQKVTEFREIKKDIFLEPIAAGAKIVLENIYFELDSHALLPESKYELQRMVDFMSENTEITVRINGFTDSTGSDEYNLDLFFRRAESVTNYLVEHGINRIRLEARGYGKQKRIDPGDTEEGRQKNRRVEFLILSTD